MNTTITVDPAVLRPPLAAAMLGIGLTRLYELLKAGELKSYTDGRRRMVTVESIRAYNARKLASAKKAPAQKNEKATAASLAARKARAGATS